MRLFTFSGIRGFFFGTNPGTGLINFAREAIAEFPASAQPEYDGAKNIDHFTSDVNLGSILTNPEAIFTLNGAPELDEEARTFAPAYAEAMVEALEGDDDSPVLILAHSQGTNNAVHTLTELLEEEYGFNTKRPVRIAMFDPKVSPAMVEPLFQNLPSFRFFFFQSELDVLGNQNLGRARRFTDYFPHGDHLWVRGLDHGSIVNPAVMGKEQSTLLLQPYLTFQREVAKKRMSMKVPPKDPAPSATIEARLRVFVRNYKPVLKARPLDALNGFLRGNLPQGFKS